jgi:hypothetical protein
MLSWSYRPIFICQVSFLLEVELNPNSNSLGVSHTPHAWLLTIMDFPKPHCRVADHKIEPYRNAGESMVHKLKVHEMTSHAKIESSSNPMDSLQGFVLPKL